MLLWLCDWHVWWTWFLTPLSLVLLLCWGLGFCPPYRAQRTHRREITTVQGQRLHDIQWTSDLMGGALLVSTVAYWAAPAPFDWMGAVGMGVAFLWVCVMDRRLRLAVAVEVAKRRAEHAAKR